jgi:hypothetical protein
MCIHFLVMLSLKTLWAGVKHWRTAPHRFYVYGKPISSPRSRNLKVIKKMCTFEVHLCMMSGQLILSSKHFNTFSMARLKILQLHLTHSPFQYHQGSYYINPCYHAWHAFFLSLSLTIFPPWIHDLWLEWGIFFILVTIHLCLLLIYRYLWNSQKWQILIWIFFIFWDSWPEPSPFFFFLVFVYGKGAQNTCKKCKK